MSTAAPDATAATPDRPASPLVRAAQVAITHDGMDAATPASATFDVAAGEVVLLLGPSGSGKSTLALALNGLIPHAVPATVRGAVTIAGRDAATTPVSELSQHVGMVFQDPDAQLVTGTVLDEVAFGPENLRLPTATVLARVETALRQVGLWERRHENPDRLSGGGKQRLAIACALAMGSPLLVLDEPTANLDPAGIEDVYATLRDIARSGRSILLIEHNLDAAAEITDRVVVLDHAGATLAVGTVDEILRDRAEELHELGVWLPVSTLAALHLRRRGWPFARLPITPDELRRSLEDAEAPLRRVPDRSTDAAAPSARADTAARTEDRATPSPRTTSPRDHLATATPRDKADGDPAKPAPHPSRTAGPAPHPSRTAGAASVIEVHDLHVTRGRTTVLHGVDLSVAAGEFVAIVGANGAGKTSLIQAIAGVVPPPRGAIRVAGVDPARADRRTLSRRIGFVFQNPEHQFIAHTVSEELAHGLRLQRLPDRLVRARTTEILERFGLASKADMHPFLLSGGQKRRLSVGTALVAGAPILALDEPTFGQDRARADELLDLLRELSDAGTTILVVTHDMQLVTDHATRTVVISDGRILADAPTAAVFADEPLLHRAGLRMPPLRTALSALTRHPELARATRLADLTATPGADMA